MRRQTLFYRLISSSCFDAPVVEFLSVDLLQGVVTVRSEDAGGWKKFCPRGTAALDALAAGRFLYIVAPKIIHDAFFHKPASRTDMLLFIGGLGIMVLFSLVE